MVRFLIKVDSFETLAISPFNIHQLGSVSDSSNGIVFQASDNNSVMVVISWSNTAPSWWLNNGAWIKNMSKYGYFSRNKASNTPALEILGI